MKDFLRDLALDDVLALQEALVVTLCGSTRFQQAFRETAMALAEKGIVSMGLTVSPPVPTVQLDKDFKETLDLLHMAKIVHSDAVVVLNVCGYIGDSTLRELSFAERIDRPVFYLEGGGPQNVGALLDGSAKVTRNRATYRVTLKPWDRRKP